MNKNCYFWSNVGHSYRSSQNLAQQEAALCLVARDMAKLEQVKLICSPEEPRR